VETVQTALTGADVYFWFMAGFGNVERLKDSNFSPIDSPTIDAFISLVVQGFFCYRIWTLNKRALWICLLIGVVRMLPAIFHRFQLALFVIFFHVARHSTSNWGSMGRYQGEYYLIRIPTLCLTWNSVSYTRNLFSCKAGSICTHPPGLPRRVFLLGY